MSQVRDLKTVLGWLQVADLYLFNLFIWIFHRKISVGTVA